MANELIGQCYACGAQAELRAFASQGELQQCLQLALQLPPALALLILDYINLFSPAQRALQPRKLKRLLTELLDGINSGQVQRKNRNWAAPQSYWQRGLSACVNNAQQGKLQLPLNSNAYLFEIIANTANNAEAQQENAREKARREGKQEANKQANPQTNSTPKTTKASQDDGWATLNEYLGKNTSQHE